MEQTPDNAVYISDLAPSGPAAKSGKIKIGDRVMEVDGQKVANQPFDKITEMMHGAKGSEVSLSILRKSNPNEDGAKPILKVVLKRDEITLTKIASTLIL